MELAFWPESSSINIYFLINKGERKLPFKFSKKNTCDVRCQWEKRKDGRK